MNKVLSSPQKRQAYLTLVTILVSVSVVIGQDSLTTRSSTLHWGLKLNPLSLIAGAGSAFIEIPFTNRNTVQIGAQYWTGFVPVWAYGRSFTRVSGVTGSYRHYFSKTAPRGGFIEPFGRINTLWEINEIGTVRIITAGCTVGKQWISKSGFSFEIFIGPYYSKAMPIGFDPLEDTRIVISKTINDHNPYNGFWIRAGSTIGFYF